MFAKLKALMYKPELYEKSPAKFWDDEHISKGMLESHLDPVNDGATNNHEFVLKSVQWIAEVAPVSKYNTLLDLGCGAGVYAELFDEVDYRVTGMDYSKRSIHYARDSAQANGKQITYKLCDYLTMNEKEQFDIVTMINYDFGALSAEDRAKLLKNIHAALKPKGLFIFDVFTARQFSDLKECGSWEYAEEGFWSAEPYILLNSIYRYDEQSTIMRQYIVLTEKGVSYYNLWDHTFTESELTKDLNHSGFMINGLYGNVAGKKYREDGKEICAVAQKEVT